MANELDSFTIDIIIISDIMFAGVGETVSPQPVPFQYNFHLGGFMKKLLTICMLAMLSFVAPAFGQTAKQWVLAPANTQVNTTHPDGVAGKKKSVFTPGEETDVAYASKDFSYYIPTHLGMTEKRPVDGVHTKALALERDTFAELLVFGNKYAEVVLQEGTVCRFEILPNGMPLSTPYALHACGNPIRSIRYPRISVTTKPVQTAAPVAAPAPTIKAPEPVYLTAPAPQVFVQVPPPQITLVPAPPTYITAPAPQVTVQQQAPATVAPVYGPPRPSVLPRYYDVKPDFREPVPARPEVKKIGLGWKILGGAILGFAVYKALDHKKKPDDHRAVVTDPASGAANGGFSIRF